jgi:hypothetical protein
VQALDHATGYLMAATVTRGLTQRARRGKGMDARLSLARTAKLLVDHGEFNSLSPLAPETPADLAPSVEKTEWGDAHRLAPPVMIEDVPLHWSRPASSLGSAQPLWL